MLKITNMASVRNFGVMSINFQVS